ncbi:uncharacterized protein LOC133134649 isoform X2 [Conger conger]|uniref:uncharacterized protein LOC133134649 isoform X2 n=1 Tax=Conger conger TaxID=82655 RepID=UPI002A5991DA|nr:uncharacterized protein LOC133134649 isoform X2 [Conger conger]
MKANDSGVYVCKIKVFIPVLEQCDGNGTILSVDVLVAKTTLIPQSVLIAAVCGATLIIFLVALCGSLWKSVRHRRLDEHTHTNTSEGYMDKRKRPDNQTEDDEKKDIKEVKDKVNITESETCADDLGTLFQVSKEDIVEARKKLKVKRAGFFTGGGKPDTSGNAHLKRKSFHLYINSRELKKQSERTPHVGPTQAKYNCTPQKKR